MINRRGFTLVEVIVSLAIIGIITVSFLTIITNNFLLTDKTKKITRTAFEIQKSVEEKIDNVKGYLLEDKIPPAEAYKSGQINIWNKLKSGGVTVKYYEVFDSNNNKIYATLMPDIKPKVFEPISLEKINLEFNKQTKTKLIYGYGGQSIMALGSFKNDEKYRYMHLTNVIEWYVSDNKFIMPIPNNEEVKGAIIEDIHEVAYYYPMFPRDYIVVKNDRIDNFGESTSEISDITPYIGKHLVYTVTPGAKSGKIGNKSVSDSIYISGLPIMKNLEMHFDANFIDSYNSNGLSETVVDNEKDLVNRWYNLYSLITVVNDNKPNEYAISPDEISNHPELLKTEMNDLYRGQFIRFEPGKNLSISRPISNNNEESFHLFVVARNNDSYNSIIIKNNEDDMTFRADNEMNKWELVEKVYKPGNGDFIFGNANIDIAEIILYRGKLSEENEVSMYLNTKYGL